MRSHHFSELQNLLVLSDQSPEQNSHDDIFAWHRLIALAEAGAEG